MRVIIALPLRGRPNIIKHGFVTTHADVEVSGQTYEQRKTPQAKNYKLPSLPHSPARFQYGRM